MDKEENQINEAENPVINNAMENDIFCEESIPNRKSEEILTRETINNLYGNEYDIISKSIQQMEEKTKGYFKEVDNQLERKFKEFNSNLQMNFVNLTNKFSTAFGLEESNIDQEKAKLLQNYTKKYLDQIAKIKDMHEQILESIKIEISILINSLDISKSLEKEKPIQKFLAKEFTNIVNSWLLIKLDFENFNFIKAINNSHLSNDFKDFVYKVCQSKNFVSYIGPTKNNDEDLNVFDYEEMQPQDERMISENFKNLTKLKINKIRNADVPLYINDNFPKLRYFKFNNCSFSDNEKKYNLLGKCNALEKLIINGAYNFEAKMLQNLSKNLTKLILSNNNFVNSDFENIMKEYIIKSDSMRMNLELLSFANNSLSKIDLESLLPSPRLKFAKLKELDFHKNRITKFAIDSGKFVELNCINCCYNKFSKSEFGADEKILVLMSGNLYLTDYNKCKEYFEILEKQVKNYNISLSHLTFSYLTDYNNFSQEYFERIVINDQILLNLRKLDLSYNNLTCDILFKFLIKNMRCIYLKDLNLSGNLLDDTFFEKYLELNYHTIFTKLKKINLNDNLIGNSCTINTAELGDKPIQAKESRILDVYKLRLIYKFIEKNKNLSKLYLTKNPMSEKLQISEDLDMNDISALISKDKDNKTIIIDSFYSFLKKINDELLMNREEKNNRGQFNIKFDIGMYVNLNSDTFNYKEKYIMFN